VSGHIGIGVTAVSLDVAKQLATEVANRFGWGSLGSVAQDVDIRSLDQGHVIPNMGPPNLPGVWYPFLNLEEVDAYLSPNER
jgi:hypothetical protein